MDFNHTEDRRMIADSLQRYLADQYDIETRNAHAYDAPFHSSEKWNEIAELGIIGALVGEADGGFGGSGFDISVVFEELGRALCPEPMLAALLATRLLAAHSQPAPLAEAMAGTTRFALAVTEADAADNLADMRAAADVVDGILNTEMKLHIQYCEGFGITPAEMEAAPPDGVSGLRAAVWKSSLISHRAGSALSVIALEARHRESRWKRVIRHHAGSA